MVKVHFFNIYKPLFTTPKFELGQKPSKNSTESNEMESESSISSQLFNRSFIC